MLLCVAKGNPVAYWGGYQGQTPARYSPPPLGPFFRPPEQAPPGQAFLPPGYNFPPPGYNFPPSGYNCPPSGYNCPPPRHFCSLPKHLTACHQLVCQQSNSMDDTCNVGLVCRNSKTGDITITTPYEEPIIISGQNNSTNPVIPNTNNTKEEPPHHGGEGMIDVRSST